MEVGREVQPTVVPAGAEQRREVRLVAGEHDAGVDPGQQRRPGSGCGTPGRARCLSPLPSVRDPAGRARPLPSPCPPPRSRPGTPPAWATDRSSSGSSALLRLDVLGAEAAAAVPRAEHRRGHVLARPASRRGRPRSCSMTSPSGAPASGRGRIGLLADQPDQAQARPGSWPSGSGRSPGRPAWCRGAGHSVSASSTPALARQSATRTSVSR